MSSESVNIGGEGGAKWQPSPREEKKAEAINPAKQLLELISSMRSSADSKTLNDRFFIILFDPLNYVAEKKHFHEVNSKMFHKCGALYDSETHKTYTCSSRHGKDAADAVSTYVQENIDPDSHTVDLSQDHWNQSQQECQNIQEKEGSAKTSHSRPARRPSETDAQYEEEELVWKEKREHEDEMDNAKRNMQAMTDLQLARLLSRVEFLLNRLQTQLEALEEKINQMREEEQEQMSEQRKTLDQAKETIKEEIKRNELKRTAIKDEMVGRQ